MIQKKLCLKQVYWWDGEYERECELEEGHVGDHWDGISWFNGDLEMTDHLHEKYSLPEIPEIHNYRTFEYTDGVRFMSIHQCILCGEPAPVEDYIPSGEDNE